MTTLVTGGSGFIGRRVVDRLLAEGERVVSYDRARRTTAASPRLHVVRGQLLDLQRLVATIADHRITRIVHAAGLADAERSIGSPVATAAANATGTAHLLEAARTAGAGGRIVLLSSIAVYGHHDGPLDEHAPLRPRTPYAATKVFSDVLGQVYGRRYELDVVSLRIGDAYGPGRVPPGLVLELVDAALAGRRLRLATGLTHPCHPVHVEDVARAVMVALRAPEPVGRVYDITGGERITLGQVVALVRDRVPGADLHLGPGPLPGVDRQGPIAITAADRELGYRPRWSLARGIDDYCARCEANGLEAGAARAGLTAPSLAPAVSSPATALRMPVTRVRSAPG